MKMQLRREWAEMVALNPLQFAWECPGFQPDEPQARILERAWDFHRIGLNCSRQWGKSTVAAVLAVHRLVTQPGVTVLVVGPSLASVGGDGAESAKVFVGFGFEEAVRGRSERRVDGIA